ncbi:hypothetical protein Q2713_003572 [Salmonella enterica]|nr:hypothetical protein [Salmonella enterica]
MKGLLTYISILTSIIVVLVIMGTRGNGEQEAKYELPTNEEQFISAINLAYRQSQSANDLQKENIKSLRDSAICEAIKHKQEISDWYGTIADISSTSSNNATLAIKLPNGTILNTWNNSLSDIGDHTIIDKKSDVYKDVYDLSIGDSIIFSGSFIKDGKQCAQETSITTNGSLNAPAFLFRFSSITKS